MKLIGRIICFVKGHRRGKFVRTIPAQQGEGMNPNYVPPQKVFVCERCNRETRYKVKPKPDSNNGAPTDGSAHFQEAT